MLVMLIAICALRGRIADWLGKVESIDEEGIDRKLPKKKKAFFEVNC